MIKLNALTWEQLHSLMCDLQAVEAAAVKLSADGVDPIFDLTPGQEITIRTGRRMPVVGPTGAFSYQGRDFDPLVQVVNIETKHPEGAEPAQTGTGPQPPAGQSAGGGVRVTAAPGCDPAPDAPAAEGSVEVAPHPFIDLVAAPKNLPKQNLAEAALGDASAGRAGTAPPIDEVPAKSPGAGGAASAGDDLVTGPLTDAEKREIAELARDGWTRQNIAAFIRRKVQTVALYLTQLEKAAPIRAADPGPAPVAPKPAPVAPMPAPDAPEHAPGGDGLTSYLQKLPRKNGWTLERDADLMRLACLGWTYNEIEADLGVQGAKARFELLTDSRSYPRARVNAALAAMLPPQD